MLVQRNDDLVAMCKRVRAHGRMAVDTEFHQEDTYYARLALVQVGVDDREQGKALGNDDIYLIDPLASGLDLDPLADLMVDPEIELVFHAADNDLVILERWRGTPATHVFDTQVAAAMLGMGHQVGYGRLMEQVCGVTLEKGESFSNWLSRPLRKSQLSYARDDVRHLLVARDRLAEQLEQKGRSSWIEEEFKRFEDPARFDQDPQLAWRRVSGARNLDPRTQVVIQAIAAWREELARSRNIPRPRVLADKTVLEFAKRRPATRRDLLSVRGLRRDFRQIDEVLAVIQRAEDEAQDLPRRSRKRGRNAPSQPDKDVLALAGAVLSALTKRAGVDSSLLANRKELEAMMTWYGEADFDRSQYRLLNGWRYELIGRDLLAFLEGRVSVQIDTDTGQPFFRRLS